MNQNKSVKIRFKGFTEAWEQRELKDVAEIVGGGTPSTSVPAYWNGSIDWYSPTEIGQENFAKGSKRKISNEGLNNSSAKLLPAHKTILFTSRATIGEAAILEREGATNQGFQSIVTKEGVDVYFLYSYKHHLKKQALIKASGSTFLEISKNEVEGLHVPVPSGEEQAKIGSFFKLVDKAITLHQRKLNRFQKIRTTFLQKMFPKNGETKPAIRLTGFNADWEQEKLQNFAVRITRKNIKKQNNRPLTISAQHGLVDQTVYFNNRVAAQDVSNYYLIKKGEFAYNRSTSKDAPVGAVRRLVDYEEGVLSTLYLVFSITDPQHVDPNYLSYFFETTGWHSWILERAAEGARNHGLLNVSSQDFLSLPVMLPSSLEEQQKIGEFFQKIDDCMIEIGFGTRNVKVEVLDVQETTRKEDAKELFRYL